MHFKELIHSTTNYEADNRDHYHCYCIQKVTKYFYNQPTNTPQVKISDVPTKIRSCSLDNKPRIARTGRTGRGAARWELGVAISGAPCVTSYTTYQIKARPLCYPVRCGSDGDRTTEMKLMIAQIFLPFSCTLSTST